MKGTLRYGTDPRALEDSFLSTVAKRTEPAVVLVGSNLLGIYLRHRLAENLSGRGHWNVRFLTFIDLATRLTLQDYARQGVIPFPRGGEDLLLERLARSIPEGVRYSEVARHDGFHRALKSTFHDLIDGGATNETGTDLLALFHKHREQYSSRFATSADTIASAAAKADRFQSLFDTGELFAFGFYDFTETQRRLLSGLSKTISIEAWAPIGDPVSFRFLSLEAIEVRGNHCKAVKSGSSAPGEFAEGEEIARKILEILEREPLALHKIGILMRNSESYREPIAQALSRAGIPFYREGGISLDTLPISQATLTLLEALGGEWRRPDLIRFLRAIPFAASTVEKIGSDADWDAWSRKVLASDGIEKTAQRIRSWKKSPPQALSFARFLSDLSRKLEKVQTSSTDWTRFGPALVELFGELADTDSIPAEWKEVVLSIRDLDSIGVPADLSKIRNVLADRLQGAKLRSLSGFDRSGVFLGSIVSARGVLFDHLFLPGINEREFPAPPRVDPLLLDSERRELNRKHGLGLAYKEGRLREERLLFDVAVTQGERNVFLSYSRLDPATSKPRLPSPFYTKVLAETSVVVRPLAPWNQNRTLPVIDQRDWLERNVAHEMLNEPTAARERLSTATPFLESSQNWFEKRIAATNWTEFDAIARTIPAVRPLRLSPSDVNTYAKCPQQYFLKKVARIQADERPEDVTQLRPMDRGEVVHQILFHLFTRLKTEQLLPLSLKNRETILSILRMVASEVFDRMSELIPTGHPLLWETERAFLLGDLIALVESEIRNAGEFIPYDFEVRFGMEARSEFEGALSTDRPLTFDLPSGLVELCGRIDRIDLTSDRRRARIIDYKTGSLDAVKNDSFAKGESMQLPVYLSALSVLIPDADLSLSEAHLLSTASGSGMEDVSFSGLMLQARDAEFRQILETTARGIREGFFPMVPGDNQKNCRICDFRDTCGKAVGRIFERKQDDPLLTPFLSIKEIE
jgi:ATP-dependent helicase/DNAse subunit B